MGEVNARISATPAASSRLSPLVAGGASRGVDVGSTGTPLTGDAPLAGAPPGQAFGRVLESMLKPEAVGTRTTPTAAGTPLARTAVTPEKVTSGQQDAAHRVGVAEAAAVDTEGEPITPASDVAKGAGVAGSPAGNADGESAPVPAALPEAISAAGTTPVGAALPEAISAAGTTPVGTDPAPGVRHGTGDDHDPIADRAVVQAGERSAGPRTGQVAGRMAGQVTGHPAGQVIVRAETRQATGTVSSQVTEQAEGQATAGRAITRVTDRAAGRAAGKNTGQVPGRVPDKVPVQTAVQVAGRTTGPLPGKRSMLAGADTSSSPDGRNPTIADAASRSGERGVTTAVPGSKAGRGGVADGAPTNLAVPRRSDATPAPPVSADVGESKATMPGLHSAIRSGDGRTLTGQGAPLGGALDAGRAPGVQAVGAQAAGARTAGARTVEAPTADLQTAGEQTAGVQASGARADGAQVTAGVASVGRAIISARGDIVGGDSGTPAVLSTPRPDAAAAAIVFAAGSNRSGIGAVPSGAASAGPGPPEAPGKVPGMPGTALEAPDTVRATIRSMPGVFAEKAAAKEDSTVDGSNLPMAGRLPSLAPATAPVITSATNPVTGAAPIVVAPPHASMTTLSLATVPNGLMSDVPQAPGSVAIGAADAAEAMTGPVRWMTHAGKSVASVTVTPAELGPVSIELERDGGRLGVALHAALAPTRDLLDALAPRLRDLLAAGGFGDVNVDVGERREGGAESRGGHERAGQGGADRGAARDESLAGRTGSASAESRDPGSDGNGPARPVSTGDDRPPADEGVGAGVADIDIEVDIASLLRRREAGERLFDAWI